MRTRRPSPEHQEAVSRRLALLSAELAAVRDAPEPMFGAAVPEDDWWSDHTRVAAPRRSLVVVPDPDPAPAPARVPAAPAEPPPGSPAPAVPVPGRHAARRRVSPGRVLAGLVPEPLRGPAGLGPAHLAVVAVLVAIGLAVTCWWVVRGDAEPAGGGPSLALDAPGPASPAALETPAPASSAGAVAAGSVTVDVAGKVRRPGIAVLDAGSRVVDAIEAAGGARRGVDLSTLNLARVLVDGEQVVVGAAAGPPPVAAGVPGATAPAAGALVDLNTATVAELELLPEVGPVTAQSIVTWRDEHGGFTAVEELLEVDGIGDKTLATIAPHVTV